MRPPSSGRRTTRSPTDARTTGSAAKVAASRVFEQLAGRGRLQGTLPLAAWREAVRGTGDPTLVLAASQLDELSGWLSDGVAFEREGARAALAEMGLQHVHAEPADFLGAPLS